MLKAADTIKRCCRKLACDSSIDLTSLVGAVSLLFTVTEAEGKVKVRHKSSQSQSVSESDSVVSLSVADTDSECYEIIYFILLLAEWCQPG